MAVYVGLTDDPTRRKTEHGGPSDWKQVRFSTEAEARAWEAKYTAQPGLQGGPGGAGWRYGYWYTITAQTIE